VIYVLTTVYVILCVLLIAAILLQQGKGASMGVLGGAGQAWFGPAGSKTLLMKITLWLAGAYLVLAVLLSLAASRKAAPIPPPAVPPPVEAPGS
jgi:preprotein translocase subunit SecG